MTTILHTADVHLGARFEGFGAAADLCRSSHLRTFDEIVQLAEARADFLVIAGDLFETHRPETQLVELVAHRFGQLAQKGKPVVLIPGTHDSYAYADSVYRSNKLGGAYILAGREFTSPTELTAARTGERIFFYGCAGAAPGSDLKAAQRLLGTLRRADGRGHHVALIHGSVMEPRGLEARPEDLPMAEPQLAGFGMDYVALGHHHAWKVFGQGDRALACYPGSPVAKSFRECGERSVALVKIEEGRAAVERIKVNDFTALECEVQVSTAHSIEEVAAEIGKLADEKGLARVHLVGAPNFVLNVEWLQAQAGPGFAFLDLLDETEVADMEALRAWEAEPTIRGIFVRKMAERIKAAEGEQKRRCEDALKLGALALARNKGTSGG